MKKFLVGIVCTSILFGAAVIPITSVMAAENASSQQVLAEPLNESEDLVLTDAQTQKAAEIEKEVQRLNSLPEYQKNEEIAKTLAEAEGQEFYFGENTGIATRAAASTNAKIVNGGINFFAYNKEGVNKLANTLGSCSAASGGATGIAALIAKFAPGISTKVAASIIAGIGGYVTKRFSDARTIVRKKSTKAGVRITATETIDITSKGINAYA